MEALAGGPNPPHGDPVPQRHLGYKQKRSHETFERLLEAAEATIAEKSFDEVSVSEICERAGLSVGAFYRRFESKDGLLQVLHERYTERMLRLQSAALAPERWEGVALADVVARVIDEVISTTRSNYGVLRASARRAQVDGAFARREGQIQGDFLALTTRLLLRRVDEIAHPQPRVACEFSAYQMRAVLQHYLLASPDPNGADQMFSGAQLARELTAAVVAYLQAPAPLAGA
jgi:AcrR family transcriptional regulator